MLFLELVDMRKDHHHCPRMSLKSMLDTFHPRHHKTRRFAHVFFSSWGFDLSLPMASSCLVTDYDCGHAVEDDRLLLLVVPLHLLIQLAPMSTNDF